MRSWTFLSALAVAACSTDAKVESDYTDLMCLDWCDADTDSDADTDTDTDADTDSDADTDTDTDTDPGHHSGPPVCHTGWYDSRG